MYKQLKLNPISKKNNFIINKDIIDKMLYETILECPFSTFPYMQGKSSKQCQRKKQGNCIALSMYLKNKLRKQNIKSFLIPASVPKKYSHSGYLNISHCALAIVDINDNIFICDPAFYFKESVYLNPHYHTKDISTSANIYTDLNEFNIFNLKLNDSDKQLNNYQSIPKNIYYVDTHSNSDISDKWQYYIIEVINPDEAISSFYINIKRLPFITIIDNNYKLMFILKYLDKNNISIKIYNNLLYSGNKNHIPENVQQIIKDVIGNKWKKKDFLDTTLNDNIIEFIEDNGKSKTRKNNTRKKSQ